MPKSTQTLRVIIPAAGFGRRVGSPNSKEMLLGAEGRPLIEKALNYCRKYSWSPLVVTRAEKTDLKKYLLSNEVETLIVEPTREWPETVLRSQESWFDWNLLFLPDVDFSPQDLLGRIWQGISDSPCDFAAATFQVDNPRIWGCIEKTEQGFCIAEKPQVGGQAWGFLFFRKALGQELFEKLLESNKDHEWKELQAEARFYPLSSFEDLTRGSK